MVTFDICERNPGAFSFLTLAYKSNPFKAERAFQRMKEHLVTGCRLYMLWNDCCNRDTEKALDIMLEKDIADIHQHINYSGGRGIPYEEDN